ALNLNLRWEEGRLVFRDPATGEPIATLESERNRAEAAEAQTEIERQSRIQAEIRAGTAEARADASDSRAKAAEVRNRELEEELRRLREG
ncbi:MAG: hypothetical protein OXI91_16580, partial [Chloroflexota bacterium]|nr:hypothetical protein [Chloroflexota bacterium]